MSNTDVQVITTDALPHGTGISFEYEVKGQVNNLIAGVYRSADDLFDPDDVEVGVFGLSGLTEGLHRHDELLELQIDPERPYVLIVLDPFNAITESDDINNKGGFKKVAVAVVTHGLEPSGTMSAWVFEMAGTLARIGYVATTFDWAATSYIPAEGYTQLAGRMMWEKVRAVTQGLSLAENDVVDLHLIGHSRGSVVISEAMDLIVNHWPVRQLEYGYKFLTHLDSHPANNEISPQYSYAPSLVGALAAKGVEVFQSMVRDPGVRVLPDGVHAEAYFQRSLWPTAPGIGLLVNLWGIPVPGVNNHDITQVGLGHTEVQGWYHSEVLLPRLVQELDGGSQSVNQDVQIVPTKEYLKSDFANTVLTFKSGIDHAVNAKAGSILSSIERKNMDAVQGQVRSLLKQIDAQQGKAIPIEFADFMRFIGSVLLAGISADGKDDLA